MEPGCLEAKADKSELCAICFTQELGEEPCVQLGCNHIYHTNCVLNLLKYKWSSLKISFGYLSCPECKAPINKIDNQWTADELKKALKLKAEV
mmetsp:Transcript_34924/g.45968  ORF Transcript_34924/g.45968 Transcript_34924/m.45968 type:complete len:93 (+) Transcript_34924:313-591(+)